MNSWPLRQAQNVTINDPKTDAGAIKCHSILKSENDY